VIFPEIIGQEQATSLLERALTTGRVPHALLFQGPEGTGKRSLAERFAAALLCTERAQESGEPACGRCRACRQRAHGNHPDLSVVTREPKRKGRAASAAAAPDEGEPLEDEDGDDEEPGQGKAPGELSSFIRIHQIRELSERASMAPREGRMRIFIVDPADRMNTESQNALLKTLEEPAGRAMLILVASRPHALLPTVRSRCLLVRFAAVPVETLAAALRARGMAADEALTRAALAAGRPGAALGLDLEELRARRDELLAMLEALAGGRRAIADLAGMAKSLAGESEDDIASAFDLVGALLRDAGRAAAGASGLVHADLQPRLAALGRALGVARAARLVVGADRLRDGLRFHVNRTLAAETLLAGVAGGPVPFDAA
jgi:DNA polymerase-3 subunit delta'